MWESQKNSIWNKKAGVNKSEEATNQSAFIRVREKTGEDCIFIYLFIFNWKIIAL